MVIAAEHRPCPKLVQLDQCSGLSVVFGKGLGLHLVVPTWIQEAPRCFVLCSCSQRHDELR